MRVTNTERGGEGKSKRVGGSTGTFPRNAKGRKTKTALRGNNTSGEEEQGISLCTKISWGSRSKETPARKEGGLTSLKKFSTQVGPGGRRKQL